MDKFTIIRNDAGELEWARWPLCTCCSHITGRPPTNAAYEWVGPNGNRSLLCVSCCAHWRMNATDDSSLLPREIHDIKAAWPSPMLRAVIADQS